MSNELMDMMELESKIALLVEAIRGMDITDSSLFGENWLYIKGAAFRIDPSDKVLRISSAYSGIKGCYVEPNILTLPLINAVKDKLLMREGLVRVSEVNEMLSRYKLI